MPPAGLQSLEQYWGTSGQVMEDMCWKLGQRHQESKTICTHPSQEQIYLFGFICFWAACSLRIPLSKQAVPGKSWGTTTQGKCSHRCRWVGIWLYSFFMLQLLSLPHREIKYQPHTFLVLNCFPGPLQDQACSLPRENTLLLHGRVYEVTEQDRSYSS